ncbi:MAG: tetratricopeptide repeat protein [Planctomycetota bacterium]
MPTIAQLERLFQADPADPFVLYGLAQAHAGQGNHAEAVAFYDRCLEADPAYHYAYYHKALAQDAAGNRAAAMETLRAGLEKASNAGDAKASGEIAELLDSMHP